MSRICGTCSSSHVLCSIEALKSLWIECNRTNFPVKKSSFLQLSPKRPCYASLFFCLPDIFGKDSALDFAGRKRVDSRRSAYKEAGNFLSTIIGAGQFILKCGYSGFTKFPNKKEIEQAIAS